LGEAGRVAIQSFWDMPSSESMLLSTISFAFTFGKKVTENKELMDNTKRIARDSDAHSVIYLDDEVYRFGFSCLLSRYNNFSETATQNEKGELELPSPTLRPTFNIEPTTEDWGILHDSLDLILQKGSPSLKKRLRTIEDLLRRSPDTGLHEADPILRQELLNRINKSK